MNKVITINLGGTAFQLEDAGYDALRAYLETAAARLKTNPDRDEILADIERALAEKFAAQLNAHKNVVLTSEVESVLNQMGPVEDEADGTTEADGSKTGETTQGGGAAAEATGPSPRAKRLYRVLEGRFLAGVCNGLAAYFGIDPTIVRLIFIALSFAGGAGIILYCIMVFVVPAARTPEEKAEAFGPSPTAQEFIRRAREGYYDAVRTFPDRHARREWKRRFKQEMREWRASFRRDMHASRHQWRQEWQQRYAANPAMGFGLPFVSLAHGVLVLAAICAIISLLSTGAILGVALPSGIPVWGALVLILIAYGMLVWPLKAARRAFYYGCGSSGAWPVFFVVDAVLWLAIVGALAWLAARHFPQIRDAINNLPVVAHDAVTAVRDWWHAL